MHDIRSVPSARRTPPRQPLAEAVQPHPPVTKRAAGEVGERADRDMRVDVVPSADAPPPSLRERLLAAERGIVLDTLTATAWNVSQAARLLGLTRVGLHRKLQSLGIRRPPATR